MFGRNKVNVGELRLAAGRILEQNRHITSSLATACEHLDWSASMMSQALEWDGNPRRPYTYAYDDEWSQHLSGPVRDARNNYIKYAINACNNNLWYVTDNVIGPMKSAFETTSKQGYQEAINAAYQRKLSIEDGQAILTSDRMPSENYYGSRTPIEDVNRYVDLTRAALGNLAVARNIGVSTDMFLERMQAEL
jgi:hypothetical protein